MTSKPGRIIAWLSFALGIGVSVAGNVLHSALTPAGLGELFGAAFWPLALMLSIEILTRVRWQAGRWWMSARVVGLLLVGIVAAVLSYRHLAGLMTSWGEDRFNAHLGPLAVDGLMLLAATALLSISREQALPEEWQGTPEEISAKAFARGATAERVAAEALPRVKVTEPFTLPWDDPRADPVGDLAAAKERYAASTGVSTDEVVVRPDWADESQLLVADPAYLESIDPTPVEKPKKAESQKLHIVHRVSSAMNEEAALQAWINSKGALSSQQLADQFGGSKSTAARRIREWRQQDHTQRRITR